MNYSDNRALKVVHVVYYLLKYEQYVSPITIKQTCFLIQTDILVLLIDIILRVLFL